MKRYWYYTYECLAGMGAAVCSTEGSEFDVVDAIQLLANKGYSVNIVTFWHEISSEQYEKLKDYIDRMND